MLIYILTGQSKLRALISTIALQRIRAVEALSTDKPVQNCNSGLLKILNDPKFSHSSVSLLRKIKKSIFFWGQPFSNMGENKTNFGQHKVLCLAKLESISPKYTSIQANG